VRYLLMLQEKLVLMYRGFQRIDWPLDDPKVRCFCQHCPTYVADMPTRSQRLCGAIAVTMNLSTYSELQ
jgi:hypothetical protein